MSYFTENSTQDKNNQQEIGALFVQVLKSVIENRQVLKYVIFLLSIVWIDFNHFRESAEGPYDISLFGKFAIELNKERELTRQLRTLKAKKIRFIDQSDLEGIISVLEEISREEGESEFTSPVVCFLFLQIFIYL